MQLGSYQLKLVFSYFKGGQWIRIPDSNIGDKEWIFLFRKGAIIAAWTPAANQKFLTGWDLMFLMKLSLNWKSK